MARGVFAALILTSLATNASSTRLNTIDETYAIPDDCYNFKIIVRRLSDQLNYSKPFLESESDYEAKRSAIKHRIWTLRHQCNPVDRVLDSRETSRNSRRNDRVQN